MNQLLLNIGPHIQPYLPAGRKGKLTVYLSLSSYLSVYVGNLLRDSQELSEVAQEISCTFNSSAGSLFLRMSAP